MNGGPWGRRSRCGRRPPSLGRGGTDRRVRCGGRRLAGREAQTDIREDRASDSQGSAGVAATDLADELALTRVIARCGLEPRTASASGGLESMGLRLKLVVVLFESFDLICECGGRDSGKTLHECSVTWMA